MNEKLCPCCSGKNYEECCQPVINGTVKAATPVDLMRARYSAYAKAEVDFIVNSTHKEKREENDRKEIENWAKSSEWLGLQILSTPEIPDAPESSFVEFIASYADRGVKLEHHELAEFRKVNDEWFFYDGKLVAQHPFVRVEPKIGRNDPCPCGSGKKYKKCCGK